MLRTTRLALTSIESVSAGVDSRKNRTVDLFYRNAALADSTTSRGGNDHAAMRLILRCICSFSHSTRAWGVTTHVFDHSAGGYPIAFNHFAGGLNARFVHFAGGILDFDHSAGGNQLFDQFAGGYRSSYQRDYDGIKWFRPGSGGFLDLSDHPAGGYATHDLRSQFAREQMRRPTRAIC